MVKKKIERLYNISEHPLYSRCYNIYSKYKDNCDDNIKTLKKVIDFVSENSDYERYVKEGHVLRLIDKSKPLTKDNLCWTYRPSREVKLDNYIPILNSERSMNEL